MSLDSQAEISIARPREQVADVMFNPKCDRLWMTGLTKVFPLQPGLLEKGHKVERIGAFMNRQFSAVHFVTACDPGRMVETTADEPFQMKMRYELADDGDGATKVSLRIQSFGELRFKVPVSILKKAVDEKLADELGRLKKHLEQSQ